MEKYFKQFFARENPIGLGLNKKKECQVMGIEFRSKYAFSIDQWLAPSSNPYSWLKVQNSRQIEQVLGEGGRVKMTSVVEALLIRQEQASKTVKKKEYSLH